jgi:hypothetical protein
MAATADTTPNLYELQSDKFRVTYSTSSISGQPQFELRQGRKTLHFSGTEIQTGKTLIGTLVTVTIEETPDLKRVLFSLLLPDVNLQPSGKKVNIKTIGIVTTIKTSIGGPKLTTGALQTYKTVTLAGTAKVVQF